MKNVLLFSLLLCIAFGRPAQETDTSMSEYVQVKHISGDINRTKRSTGRDFPTIAVFEFEMSIGHVVLDLVRNEGSDTHLPIYILGENGVHLRNIETKENYAIYQDVPHGASVLIKYVKDSVKYFELFGEFIHNGSHYMIEPSITTQRIKRDEFTSGHGRERHLVKRQLMESFDFHSDAIYPPSVNWETLQPKIKNFPMVRPGEEEPVPHVLPLEKKGPEDTKRASSDSSKSSKYRKRDRRETGKLYIEYLVVVDYRNFKRWKDKVHGESELEKMDNAFKAMAEFYELIVNGIDLRFRTATGTGPELRVVFANLLVSTMEQTSPWITNNKLGENSVDDEGMLLDFAIWRNAVYKYLPKHDHAALFTGFDLATYVSSNPIGMAYLNSVCHSYWAVSETEETYNAMTVHIAAHELGHNIGSRHDGTGNGCSSAALYLMAPRLPFVYNQESRSNPWTFSTCSQTSIKTFLSGLNSDNCLTNKPDSVKENEEGSSGSNIYDGKLVRLRYSPDMQCNMTYGNDAVLCRENLHNHWDSICYAMQCKTRGSSTCGDRFFAFDGTPCGDKMWCKTGKCLYSEEAPPRHPSCLFGDDPGVTCNVALSCNDDDDKYREILCCGTCLGLNRNTTAASTTSVKPTPELSSTIVSSTTSDKSTTELSSTLVTSTSSVKPTSELSSTTTSSTTSDKSTTELSSTVVTPTSSEPTPESLSTTASSTTSDKPTTEISSSTASSTSSDKPTSKLSSTTLSSTTPELSSTTVSSTTPVQSTPELSSTTVYSTTSTTEPNRSSTISTTVSSTSESVRETTPDKQTNDPNSLSFKLQSLVSLFVAAAIVI